MTLRVLFGTATILSSIWCIATPGTFESWVMFFTILASLIAAFAMEKKARTIGAQTKREFSDLVLSNLDILNSRKKHGDLSNNLLSYQPAKFVKNCLICKRINQIKANTNPYYIAELETGYIVAGDFQFFKGYSLFLCKLHVPELHQLERSFKLKFLDEMSVVAEAVFRCFQPEMLNYEALGNAEPHLHWHIFPRYKDDPNPRGPTWQIDKSLRYSEKFRAGKAELIEYKKNIINQLEGFSRLTILDKGAINNNE